ncbi:hypothetical protein DERP_002233 [Dermatophagoides pteronyssinus]|uniref:Uncharacterized protein n=1 Tax=Dermatophagoides pteronyssinus TaxID=6956 RepID=A0ABQ8JH64_DERPT|nr:hypothetical protein DERP_002233 [Dermatophagoides pteronyssinus]
MKDYSLYYWHLLNKLPNIGNFCEANVVASVLISQHSMKTLSNPANFCKALYINASAISTEVAYNGCGIIVEN